MAASTTPAPKVSESLPTPFEAWPTIRAAILERYRKAIGKAGLNREAYRAAEAKKNAEMAEAADKVRPPPIFASWADYLQRTTLGERMNGCHNKANKANKRSSPASRRLRGVDVWNVMKAARGRCVYCGSLAVERSPGGSWGLVGRRIGSLEHLNRDCTDNDQSNLAWACHWCNTETGNRHWHASDHGGFYPEESDTMQPQVQEPETSKRTHERADDDDGDFEMYPDHECPWDVGHAD
jgi:hypothetical protein